MTVGDTCAEWRLSHRALHGKPRTATAAALDDTVLLTLPGAELLAELSPRPAA